MCRIFFPPRIMYWLYYTGKPPRIQGVFPRLQHNGPRALKGAGASYVLSAAAVIAAAHGTAAVAAIAVAVASAVTATAAAAIAAAVVVPAAAAADIPAAAVAVAAAAAQDDEDDDPAAAAAKAVIVPHKCLPPVRCGAAHAPQFILCRRPPVVRGGPLFSAGSQDRDVIL